MRTIKLNGTFRILGFAWVFFGACTSSAPSAGQPTDASAPADASACWLRALQVESNGDNRVVTQPDGRVFVSGWLSGELDLGAGVYLSGEETAAMVVELDREGNVLWGRAFPVHPASARRYARLALAAAGGYVYLASFVCEGSISDAGIDCQGDPFGLVLVKLDGADGHVLWSNSGLSLSEQTYIDPEMVALEDGGAVLVGSFPRGTLQVGNESIEQQGELPGSFVARFDGAGELGWYHSWSDGTSVRDVTVGPDGSVWVAGAAPSPVGDGTSDLLVMQFDPASGDVLHTMPSVGAEVRSAYRLVVDADESVVVLGASNGVYDEGFVAQAGKYALGGFTKQGQVLWQTTLGDWSAIPPDNDCYGCSFRTLALDPTAGVFVGGSFCGSMELIPGNPSLVAVGGYLTSLSPTDAVLAHFDRSGTLTWRESYGLKALSLQPMTLSTDGSGGLIATMEASGVFEKLTDPVQLGCVSTAEYERGMVLHLPAEYMH